MVYENPDPQAEQVLKLSAKFYKHLAQITKLLIAPRGCRQPRPGLKFQKLAEVACKKLTAPLYNFMALVQRVWYIICFLINDFASISC